MAGPSSWRARAVLIAGLLGVVAVVGWALWPASDPAAARLEASLVAARPWIGPLGSIDLEAQLTGLRAGVEVEYEWSASGGFVHGKGPRPIWIAPSDAGRYQVTLIARAGERTATAAIDLDVRPYRGMILDEDAAEPEPADGDYAIGEVSFDRPRLCKNDDVVVRVQATDPSGSPEWILPVVRFPGYAAEGFEAVGRVGATFHADPRRAEEVQVDLIDIRTRATVATRTVPFVVEDCETANAGLRVQCRGGELRDDEVVCEVHLWDEDAPPPVRYEWRVVDDDAAPVETTQAWARLALPLRPETAALTSYLIEVRAHQADGTWRDGRASYAHHNSAWETSMLTGVLQLQVVFDGAPRPRGDQYVTHVSIRNPFAEVVSLDSMQVTRYPCGEGAPAPIVDAPLEPAAVLGKATLGPGEIVAYDWVMPVDEARCAAQVDLTGEGLDTGLVATGLWVMPTDPSRRVAVTGDNQKRLRAALDILSRRRGKPVDQITEVELADLVREGLIEPLDPPPPPEGPLEPGQNLP